MVKGIQNRFGVCEGFLSSLRRYNIVSFFTSQFNLVVCLLFFSCFVYYIISELRVRELLHIISELRVGELLHLVSEFRVEKLSHIISELRVGELLHLISELRGI